MTDVMQHGLNLLGATRRSFSRWWLFPGRKVTLISWRGCMADTRHERAVGRIVGWQSKKIYGSSAIHRGIIVRYDGRNVWEPLERVRLIGGRLGDVEVWS